VQVAQASACVRDILSPQITVLDAGGQYCHLIARKVRDLGIYAEVAPSETPVSSLRDRKAIIISGGPASVYDPSSPTIDPALLTAGVPVLGICYGQQLMAHILGGHVRKGDRGEYGFAQLDIIHADTILNGIEGRQQVWMNHRDLVISLPDDFEVLASTETCAIAAMSSPARRLFAVQFHPEVAHTPCGLTILKNFLFDVCHCVQDWDPVGQIQSLEEQIRAEVGDRNVFFFVSGGVDSTVAYTLCLQALGPDRVHGTYVDTGLMREGETEFVRKNFEAIGARSFEVADARTEFLTALSGAIDPEQKRHIIGEKFVDVQQHILAGDHFLDTNWILGQGTIYPDTIESGGTAKAELIKTHHNRVAGIQRLIAEGRIIEPLSSFYKDEVRAIGRQLGLAPDLLDRHPFPGPGLAIRCLCSDSTGTLKKTEDGYIIPLRSVGVQGDARTYRSVLAIENFPETDEEVPGLINKLEQVNRVVVAVWTSVPIQDLRVEPASLTEDRLDLLRKADGIVRKLTKETRFDAIIWQNPVILIPVGALNDHNSIVLRPIDSVDGMTASAVRMPASLLENMVKELRTLTGIAGVFYDLTNKPPGTIEWE
jgi:GMP synthase (glutamine-hydrolysing)